MLSVHFSHRAYDFPTDLIILKSQGLDIILGMDWLAKYKVLLIVPVGLSLSVHQPGRKSDMSLSTSTSKIRLIPLRGVS